MISSPLFQSLSPLGRTISSVVVTPLTYLLRILFSTDDDAPMTSPYSGEVGSVLVTDASNIMSAAGGVFVVTGTPAANSGLRESATRAQIGGQILAIKKVNIAATNNLFRLIVSPNTGMFADGATLSRINSTRVDARFTVVYTSEPTWYAIVKRLNGGAFYVCDNTLVFVSSRTTISGNNYSGITFQVSVPQDSTWDYLTIGNMGAPWDAEYDLATNRIASPSAGDTTTQEANATVEFTWTPGAGETLDLMVRRTDDDNTWILRASQSESTLKIIQKQGGTETERASGAQTLTAGVTIRLVGVMYGNTISFGGGSGDSRRAVYTFATFNNTATGVKTSHAGADLIAWPRDLSGAALTELQRWLA